MEDLIREVHGKLKKVNKDVQYIIRPKKLPALSFHLIPTSPIFHGDGELRRELVPIQVDIWTKSPLVFDIVDKIKKEMTDDRFFYTGFDQFYEDDSKLYHSFLIFNYYHKEG